MKRADLLGDALQTLEIKANSESLFRGKKVINDALKVKRQKRTALLILRKTLKTTKWTLSLINCAQFKISFPL